MFFFSQGYLPGYTVRSHYFVALLRLADIFSLCVCVYIDLDFHSLKNVNVSTKKRRINEEFQLIDTMTKFKHSHSRVRYCINISHVNIALTFSLYKST